jgi:hypothetical protein
LQKELTNVFSLQNGASERIFGINHHFVFCFNCIDFMEDSFVEKYLFSFPDYDEAREIGGGEQRFVERPRHVEHRSDVAVKRVHQRIQLAAKPTNVVDEHLYKKRNTSYFSFT